MGARNGPNAHSNPSSHHQGRAEWVVERVLVDNREAMNAGRNRMGVIVPINLERSMQIPTR